MSKKNEKNIEKNNKKYSYTPEQLAVRLKNLKEIITIIKTENINDEAKAYRIYDIYGTLKCDEKFRQSYSILYKMASNDEMFADYIKYYNSICEILADYSRRGLFEKAMAKKRLLKYYMNYEEAKKFVFLYINSEDSYKYDFFKNLGIDARNIEFHLETLEKLGDTKLLKAYKEKEKENAFVRMEIKTLECDDVIYGIMNRYFLDGTRFDILEFLKRVPFKDKKESMADFREFNKILPEDKKLKHAVNLSGRLNNFTNLVRPEYRQILAEFLKGSGLGSFELVKPLDLVQKFRYEQRITRKVITNNSANMSEILFTEEDFDNVIKIMMINGYPFMEKVFLIVREKYINGEYNLEELNEHDISMLEVPNYDVNRIISNGYGISKKRVKSTYY